MLDQLRADPQSYLQENARQAGQSPPQAGQSLRHKSGGKLPASEGASLHGSDWKTGCTLIPATALNLSRAAFGMVVR